MTDLKDIKCFLLDMDGTFYLGNKLIDGAIEFLEILKSQNKDFIFVTNNSSQNSKEYKKKLENLGVLVDEDKVFTSGEATTIFLKKEYPNSKIYLMGTELLEEEFEKSGFTLIKNKDDKPDYVVLGFDTTMTYDKIWYACDYIREGVTYIATHPDFNCPLEGGKYKPDAGAIISMIKASTEKEPIVIGKPNPYIIDAIVEKYSLNKNEIAIVGDRLYTDIQTGINSSIISILVLSGETTKEMYSFSEIKPDYVFDSLKELGYTLKDI